MGASWPRLPRGPDQRSLGRHRKRHPHGAGLQTGPAGPTGFRACWETGPSGITPWNSIRPYRYRLPIVAVVGNDARWNAEYQLQLDHYGSERTVGCELLAQPLRPKWSRLWAATESGCRSRTSWSRRWNEPSNRASRLCERRHRGSKSSYLLSRFSTLVRHS